MCGIFGIAIKPDYPISSQKVKLLVSTLFKLSESRGKEASGLAIRTDDSIVVLKEPIPASKLLKTKEYNSLFNSRSNIYRSINGHARLVTNGSMADNKNNQPVISLGIIGIHNGIITNDFDLWRMHPELKRQSEVDTEIILSLIRHFLNKKQTIDKSLVNTFGLIEGSASISLLFNDFNNQILATNTGSVYYCFNNDMFIYASEEIILKKLILKFGLKMDLIKQLPPNKALLISLDDLTVSHLDLRKINRLSSKQLSVTSKVEIRDISKIKPTVIINDKIFSKQDTLLFNSFYQQMAIRIDRLKRCSRCLLPETMPYIWFDSNNVCNYCHNYKRGENRGLGALDDALKPYKRSKSGHNCIVSFSGGRDSCFALHYVKTVLKLNPIAYSYDWGMLTDLGRRNQARMCGKLGIEHLLISADIQEKRENIRKNVLAWLKKPNLGMIPLFMAGDKQYFYYLNKLKKETNIDLVIYADNFLEKTDFKYGFADVGLTAEVKKAYEIGKSNSIKLIYFYLKQFVQNPGYINSSIIDTIFAYFSSYIVPKDYLYLYRYLKWDETTINKTLINNYNWELSPDTKSTWRIGDGTASFYNYIYYILAGFTENDTFRSNQIREGLISRDEAIKIVNSENKPRWDSIKWYCDTIGIDMVNTINTINRASKLY